MAPRKMSANINIALLRIVVTYRLRAGSYNEPSHSQSNHYCILPGGEYNNAIINIGGHFTRCHISVNIEFTNLCSKNQHNLTCILQHLNSKKVVRSKILIQNVL